MSCCTRDKNGRFLRLGVTKVRLQLANLAKLLLRVLGGDRRGHDHVVAHLPVDRGGDALLVARLQGVDDAQDLGGVTAGRGGVHHGETDLLARVDDEDGADGERNALLVDVIQVLLVDHIVQEGDLAVGIGDNGELHVRRGDLVNVLDPLAVGADVVGALFNKALVNRSSVRK